MTKQHIPKIRFQGFDDEWEKRKLKEFAKLYQPKTISQSELVEHGYPVFGANGYIGFYYDFNHEFDQVTVSARGEKTGTPNYVEGPSWITGNSMVIDADKALTNKQFLYQLLLSRTLKNYVTGGAQPQLTREVLGSVEKSLPSLPEQKSIGQFFRTLDELISAYKDNLEHYQSLKASMLSKMFPKEGQKQPEIRLDGFQGDWEEKKLKDIAEFNPKSIIPNEFNYVDLESVIGTTLISHKRLSKDEAPSRAQRTAKKNDIFFQTVRPYQKNNFLFLLEENDWVFSTGYAQIRTKIDSSFLFVSLQRNSFVKDVLLNCTGTSYPAINSKDLSNLFISLPSPPEQEAIGAFFANLDETISSYKDKVGQLELLKKNLLSQMFI